MMKVLRHIVSHPEPNGNGNNTTVWSFRTALAQLGYGNWPQALISSHFAMIAITNC